MVTKALHLELVSDLSSAAFLAALRRMSARLGAPCHLYSDCRTNFVGANRAIQEEYEQLRQIFDDNFLSVLANMNIEWHFNAPSWPSAGGLWERAVQSLKFHLRRVMGEQRLTFEEYSTVLAQLEACLNSRPLCALTKNIEDLEYLSPAHYLTGGAGLTIIQTTEDARTRWHLTTEILQQIWKKWKSEYLLELTVRTKWFRPQRNIEIGDLVTIHDDNLPAGKWPMARVFELHPGSDGHVRVGTLKTEKGYLKWPIVKLSILPIQKASSDSDSSEQLQENKTRNKRSIGHSTLHSIVMALLFFTTLVSTVSGTSNITHLNEKQTLYFNPLAKLQLLTGQKHSRNY
ncbi:unnamed protein product [Parnassius mnemosyne]|uniref:Integrase catalytic domain-containing protein n=1 Tax=Parnassius mnemosyne TaxID=213953 RepID=A0AAV1KGU9_9NEOP